MSLNQSWRGTTAAPNNPSSEDASLVYHTLVAFAIALEDDERRRAYPWKFYGLTDDGREFLEEHNLFKAEETLQRIYETITDKPDKMFKDEKAPRPTDR